VQDLGTSNAFAHEKNCVSQGAHLMSVQSSVASAALAAYGQSLWVGLFDHKVEGSYHWFGALWAHSLRAVGGCGLVLFFDHHRVLRGWRRLLWIGRWLVSCLCAAVNGTLRLDRQVRGASCRLDTSSA
jgi:hypothetical protein